MGDEHRERENGADGHQHAGMANLLTAFLHLLPLGQQRVRGGHPGRAGRYGGPGRCSAVVRFCGGVRLPLDAKQPMHHVHAACKGVVAGRQRRKRHLGGLVARQHRVRSEVGEHDMRRAFAGLLPIEPQRDRNAGLHRDDIGGVPTPDRDGRLLNAVMQRRPGASPSGREEESQDAPCQHGGYHQCRHTEEDVEFHRRSFPLSIIISDINYTLYP